MNAFTRMFGRVRDHLVELGESIAGSQAQRELDEEIRDTDMRLRELRTGLATLKARRITTQERIDITIATILQREAQALASLEAGKAALAREVAAEIVQLEHVRDDEQSFLVQLEEQASQLRALLEQGENTLRRLQHQLDVLRTAETVQRAQEIIAGRQHGATPQTAVESLLRARQQHSAADATHTGREQPPGNPGLDAQLEAAGIDERNARAQIVLDRIALRLADMPRPAARRARTGSAPRNP